MISPIPAGLSAVPPRARHQSAESRTVDQVAPDMPPQLEQAARTLTNGLADICHIYKYCSSHGVLQLVAGLGCPEGASQCLSIGDEHQALEAYALSMHSTVIAEHLAHDRRFSVAPVADQCHVASGLAVVIEGETAPFGVCSVYSRRPRSFSPADVEIVEEVSRALTERFRSARLVRDRARFAAVTMALDEAVVELTLDGRMFGWNAAAEALYGYRIADIAGQPIEILFAPAVARQCAGMLEEVKGGLSVGPVDTVIRRSDGAVVDVELRLVPIILSDARVAAASMIARDLTPQRKADHERRALLDRLQHSQRMEVIGRLAGGVAHDFNNLLTVIMGCTELIQSRVVADETVLEDLRQIDHASRSAVQLARHLLTFRDRDVTRVTNLDLAYVVRCARGMLRRLIGAQIQLLVLEGEGPVVVRADAVQIERVLINLAVNARDAMPEGGRIFIESSLTTITGEQASRHPDLRAGTFGRLQVSDTGAGIDAATLPRLFEPFFTTKDGNGGVGLGLSTVRDIVDQHGGFITVHSESGAGAIFNIYIPAVEPVELGRAA